MIDVVAAIMRNEEGKIFIARRRFGSMHGGKWEFPGGKVEAGESYQEALARELFEEFGIKTEVLDHFLTSTHQYGHVNIQLHSYFVKNLSSIIEMNEHEDLAWVTTEDFGAYDFVEADMQIVSALQKLVPRL